MIEVVNQLLELNGNTTANGQSIPFKMNSATAILLQLSGTFVGINAIFEISNNSTDGVNGVWIPVNATRNNASTVESTTGVLGAAPAYMWDIYTGGARWFRIRSTAWTSGTGVWNLVLGTFADATVIASLVGNLNTVLVAPFVTLGYSLGASLASTNSAVVKATIGSFMTIQANNTGAACFIKLYNKSTAPVVGTDIPVMTIPLPANGFISEDFGAYGVRFLSGIGIAITGLAIDTDVTAIAANQVKLSVSYA